jgi:hypothetical protein
MVRVADADLVESAMLAAVTVTVGGVGTVAGEIYRPLLETVPQAAPEQPAPLTVQSTAVFELPLTLAAIC